MLAKMAPINIKKVSKYEYIITPTPLNIPLLEPTNTANFKCNSKNIIFSTKKVIKILSLGLKNIMINVNIIRAISGIPIRTLE